MINLSISGPQKAEEARFHIFTTFAVKLPCDFYELKANGAARFQSGASEQGSLPLMEGDHTSYGL